MTLRALVALTTLAALLAPAAFAADMPESPPVIYAQPEDGTLDCGPFGTRPIDHVWRPGQVAYIVAKTCGAHTRWLDRVMHQRRENVLVYYNGGTWYRPDVRVINTPYQPQLH